MPGPLMSLSGILHNACRQGPARADLCNHEQQVGLDGVPSTANNFALKPLKPDPRQEKLPISAAYFPFQGPHTHAYRLEHTKICTHWVDSCSFPGDLPLTITTACLSWTLPLREPVPPNLFPRSSGSCVQLFLYFIITHTTK